MSSRVLQFELACTDRPAIEATLAAQTEALEDAALEQARVRERRAILEQLDVSLDFDSDTTGVVVLEFHWTVRNACADQTFADRGQLRLPFCVENNTLCLSLPPEPVEREPDEI